MDCSQHFGKCRQCADSFFIQPISSTPFTHCVDGTGIEVGYGKDLGTPASQLLMPCTAASCSDCAADRQICRRCQAGLFLDDQILASSGFPSCQSISSVVTDPAYSKAGISNSSMAIRECRADCLKCTYDAAGCENCDLGKYLLKEGSNFFCEELIYLESHEGYGVDLTQPAIKKIRRCSDPNCKVCKGDFSDCTECQTTYYLYADPKVNMKSVCVGPSQATFFPFTGIATGATPPRVGPCSIQNCAAQGCRSDNAYCSSCKQNFVIQILSPNENACIQDSPVVPIGYGKDISDSTIKPCLLKASNCALCPQDYRVCEQCQNGYLMNTTDTSSPNSLCLLPNQEYPGLGIDLANTLLLRPCQDSNCEQCPSDFSKCESCKVGFLVDKISIPIRSWCRSELDFVEFVGKNGQLIALCKDLGCSNCFLDFQTCLECGTGLTLNTESIQNLPKCLPIEDLPIGYGADSNKKLIPCIDPLCRTCHDAATCSICSENAYLGLQGKCELCRPECKTCSIGDSCLSCNDGYYLMKNSAPHQMNCINGPPSGFGIDSRDRSIMPCSDSNCEICLSDFESCSVCKGVFKLLIDTQSLKGRCIDTQTALNGYGWHSISSTYRKCEVQNCYWCWDDNSICSTCLDPQSPTFYTLSIGQTTTCVGESDIPSKYGIDWTDKTVKPCSTSHCLFCSSDYSNCTKCEDGYSLLIDSDGTHRCISSGLDGFGTDPGTSLTVACSDLRCKGCQQNFQQCSACYAGYLTTWPPAQLSIPCLTLGSSLKEGPDPAALNTTTFATTPRLLPCFDSLYCDDCSLSYLLCQKCKAGTFHYRVDPPLLRAESPFASYYLGAEFYRCLSPSATWPLAYGEDIENQKKELKPCSSGCSSCSSNYKVCQQCPVTFFVAVDGRCISPDMLSSIEGQGIARWNSNFTIKSQTLSLCDDSNCLNCTNWNSNCVRCKASYNLDQQNGACKSNAALKDSGLGPNLQTSELIIVPCQDQRCFNCNQDHTKCTSCKLQYLYFTDETYQTVTCYLKDELITHKKNLGPLNVNSQQLVLCESKCKTCPSIYNKCSSCLDDEAFLTPEQDCVPYSQLQRDLSNGLDIVTRSKLPCQAALCKDCWANYLLCTSCSADTSLVLEKATTVSACYSQTNIPAGKGASIVEEIQFIEKCRLEGCSRCAEDSSICLECDSGRYQELDVTSRVNVCHKTMDSVSAPFGKNGNSFILKPCAAGCLNCKDDYRLCSTCKEGWYLFQGKCFPESNVPPKTFGKDRQASFYRYLPCLSELNCKECYDNFRVCDVCLDGYGFDIKKTCVPISVNTPGYGSNGTAVVPCDVKNCARCSSYYKICTECKKGYLSQAKSDGSTACIAAVENPRGYGIVGTTSIPCQVQHCEVCTYNSYGCEYCSNHYFVLSNGNKTLCVLREDIPRGYGVKDFQAVPCTEQNCLDCTLNNKNCLECRAGFYPSLEDSDQICLSNERTVQKKALEAAALNEGLQKYQNDINSGLLLLKFVVDVSEINNKNLIYNAFDSTSGKRLGDLKVTNFELGSDNHTISFSLDLPEPTRPFDLLIQTNRSIFALKSRKRLLSRSLQLQKQEASSSDPFSKGVLISDIQFTRPGLTWIKVSGLIMSISMMVAAAASFLRDSTYCYRLVELSIMIGMFSVWSCPKPLAFSQFIYWFRYSLFGIIPFVEVNEDFVRCVGDGPLAFQGYSCFIYNNTRTFIPSFFAWLLLLLIIGRLSASSLLKKVGNLSTKIELETKKPDKSGPILTTHMLKFWLSLALPVSYFAFINLYYMNESTAMKFGFFLSLLAIFFYAATLLLGFISVAKLTEDQEKLTSIIHLTFLLGLEIHPESKPQLKYARLYEILRNFLLGAVLALLNTSPLAQSIAAFVTLLVYLPFLIYFSPYKAADLTRFYITKEIFALYLSLCLLISASSRLSVDSLQQGVGAATCIGVLILLIASFFLVLYPFCAKRSSSRTFNN
jgi:hypothetical protein